MTYEAENESESPKSARCISVDIPSDASTSNNTSANTSANTSSSVSSSVSSSLAPSPAGILESRQSTTSTTSLPTPSLNVKFAPLPELAPRKRRSLAPLGVASRSQLMRRRRGYDRGEPPMPTNPMWTDEETRAVSHRQPRRQSDEELEDPFVALGKMVKGASKQLWRKVSNKEKEGKGEKDAKPVDGGGMDEKVDANNEPRQVLATLPSNLDERLNKSEGDGVWEGEVGDTFPQDIGQTETIVEGFTKYSWASEVDAHPPRSPEHEAADSQLEAESDVHRSSTSET